MSVKDLIRKHALANALAHNGKANPGAIIGKLISEDDKLKSKIKELQPDIQKIVKEVNALKPAEQEAELRKIFPEFFEKKEAVSKDLPELPNAVQGKVVTRLAPEPNGHLHIGHGIAFFFNHYYAKRYNGKCVLRFEDTNPQAEKKEFYESIAEDLDWLGIEYAERKNNSDDVELFYKHGEALLEKGELYVCQCPVELMRENRGKGKECECRKNTPEQNIELWKKMLKDLPEGIAVVRLKGDLKAKNSVMRDPTMFRVILGDHPFQGTKYRVWPLYDFANAIEDAVCGVTHVIRSHEFDQRNELQNHIRDLLGLKNPEIISYTRIQVEASPTSKRFLKPMVESGEVMGWDDPRLATIKGLKRRGIIPETVHELGLEVRMTRGSTTIDWKAICGVNKKLLEEKSDHYYFVPEPVKVEVKDAPEKTAELALHPSLGKGTRKIKAKNIFYIPKEDAKKGKMRLKGLYNINYLGNGKAEYAGEELVQSMPKIQWVTDDNVELELLIPDVLTAKDSLQTVKGLGEFAVGKLKAGDIVQFERVGFCRKDSDKVFIRAHK
ncbi:MAG: glutamate--tRNA ligase [archaeon]